MKLPSTVMVGGIPHTVSYHDKPSDVDLFQRESMWGQHDPWTKSIRVYKDDNPYASIFKVLLHEIIHGYGVEWNMDELTSHCEKAEENVDVYVRMFFDILSSNPWMSDAIEEIYHEKQNCANLSM